MNSIHFVIKRLANIRKYFKQKGFFRENCTYGYTVLSFKTIPIILVILRKTIIFAHSDA